MDSKTRISTEDEIAYKFFESLEKLYESINLAIENVQEAIRDVNEGTLNEDYLIEIDEDIPNIGITLNNKLVEIYQQFKQQKIKVFISQNEEKDTVSLSTLPSILFIYLINATSQIAEENLAGFFKRYKEISKPKEEIIDKIENNKNKFIRTLNEKIWEIRVKLNPEVCYETYFSDQEVDELSEYIENYTELDTYLREFNLEEQVADTIISFFEVNEFSSEQIENILRDDIEIDLKRLGLQNQIPYIRARVKEEFEKSELKPWEISEKQKKEILEETAKIQINNSSNKKQEKDAEYVR